jgi:branched-chain amino acid transport system permease protein
VSGALAGGLLLALVEGVGSTLFGPSHATTLSFVLLIVFLILRPQGLLGRKGFE